MQKWSVYSEQYSGLLRLTKLLGHCMNWKCQLIDGQIFFLESLLAVTDPSLWKNFNQLWRTSWVLKSIDFFSSWVFTDNVVNFNVTSTVDKHWLVWYWLFLFSFLCWIIGNWTTFHSAGKAHSLITLRCIVKSIERPLISLFLFTSLNTFEFTKQFKGTLEQACKNKQIQYQYELVNLNS